MALEQDFVFTAKLFHGSRYVKGYVYPKKGHLWWWLIDKNGQMHEIDHNTIKKYNELEEGGGFDES